jgi:hypothetical protein
MGVSFGLDAYSMFVPRARIHPFKSIGEEE